MSQRFVGLEASQAVVRKPNGAGLTLLPELQERCPVLLELRAVERRPVHLEEIDPLGPDPTQRVLEPSPEAMPPSNLLCRLFGWTLSHLRPHFVNT